MLPSIVKLTEVLKAKGLNVSAQYISTIKSNMNKKKARRKRRGAAKVGPRPVGGASLFAAVELVKVAGGLEAARQALGTVAQIARIGSENA